MDRLELELRELLSDERLDVPLRPGAAGLVKDGVRRRRRNRAIVSSTAAGVVVLATVTASAFAVRATHGGDAVLPGTVNSPTPSSSATTSPTPTSPPTAQGHKTATIGWRPATYNAATPFAFPGTVPYASTPWCTSKGLALTASGFQGATGSAAGSITITNHGAACAVQGVPVVTGLAADGTAIAQSAPADGFVVHPWFVLLPGHRATSTLQIFGDQAPCQLGPVSRLDVDLGHGARTLSTGIISVTGGDVAPRCGTAPASQQVDHYTVAADTWLRPDGTPKLAVPQLTVAIAHAPRTAMQGTLVHFQVVMSGTPPTQPCLPYQEQLTSADGTQTVITTEAHLLNCAAIQSAGSARSYLLDMQVRVPSDAAVGDASLTWETPLPGIAAGDAATIHITAAPPKCQGKQLSLTEGPRSTKDGWSVGAFVFTNTSSKVCSLHGFAGIQLVGVAGRVLPSPHHWLERTRFWNVAAQTYVLAPHGGTVSFTMAADDADASGTNCPSSTAIRFIPPGGYAADQLQIANTWPACGRHRPTLMSPVVPGTSGPTGG